MSQSEAIAGALLGGFVIWLLMNGRLAAYWALLTGGGVSAAAAGSAAATPSGTGAGSSPLSFIAGSVQQIGTIWAWKDAATGVTRISPHPPTDYVPPSG